MAEDAEFWFVVFEQVTFELNIPHPLFAGVKMPEGCTGFLPVFSDYGKAVEYAGGDHRKVQCAKVERRREAAGAEGPGL
jgi:hypothetical protein